MFHYSYRIMLMMLLFFLEKMHIHFFFFLNLKSCMWCQFIGESIHPSSPKLTEGEIIIQAKMAHLHVAVVASPFWNIVVFSQE